MKTFAGDFYKLLNLLKAGEPFAFNRFSDGELYILQDKELVFDAQKVQVGAKVTAGIYGADDYKSYQPGKHSFYRDRLIEAFRYQSKNYFKGLSCRCCVGEENFQWQLDFHGKYDENFTWANLLLNSNYPRFIREMYPVFNNYKTVFVCNESADLSMLPFLVKDFRVGYNAMENDYGLIETIKNWIDKDNIEGYLFLFSASSFSKMAIHQLYAHNPRNTYLDAGTTLIPFMGIKLGRTYLKSFWLGTKGEDLNKTCIW
jgi:hypothetical protein